MKNFILVAALLSMPFSGIQQVACAEEPKIKIVTGGYEFHTSYKLGMQSSSSYLLVDTITGRGTGMIKCAHRGRVLPASFFTTVRSKIGTRSVKAKMNIYRTGEKTFHRKNIKSSSKWYPGLKKLANQITSLYYDCDATKKDDKKSKEYSRFTLKAQRSCKLETFYSFHLKAYDPNHFPSLPSAAVVKVVTTMEMGPEGKKVLTAVATFHAYQRFTPEKNAILKLLKTKRGFQEIKRVNLMKNSSLYRSTMEVAKRSIRQYCKLKSLRNKVHESFSSP